MENTKCSLCNVIMKPNNSGCKYKYLIDEKGKHYKRIKYGDDNWGGNGACGDCNVKEGAIHHQNCDIERCPKCSGQLLSCDCDWREVATMKKSYIKA